MATPLTQSPDASLLATGNFLLCLAATLFMTGVIWTIQLTHYPLFAQVGPESFPTYHANHSQRISFVVILPMLIEAATTALLVLLRPAGVPAWAAWLGVALLAVVWGSTFLLQVPYHSQLGVVVGAERAAAIDGLVASNWWRTLAWTGRSLLMLALTAGVLLRS